MAGLVITIAQRKGGAGKTTLATQLAVVWAKCGARVAALDIDPQGSFSAWVELRRARLGAKAIGFDFAALPGWRAAQWVDDRLGGADLVLIDAPPHAETGSRCARQGWSWFRFSPRRSICGRRRRRSKWRATNGGAPLSS
jgi:chromosome partitioning protein